MKYMVKVTQSFGAFVVVEAADESEAEDTVADLVDSGVVDVIGLKGTLKHGDGGLTVECTGETDLAVTASGEACDARTVA